MLERTTKFADELKAFIEKQLPDDLTATIRVEKRLVELDVSQFIFRIGLVDPYLTSTIYEIVDIHHCHESTFLGEKNYCQYLERALKFDGIIYAPKDLLSAELDGALRSRRQKYSAAEKEAAEVSATHIDELSENVEELFDKLEQYIATRKIPPHEKISTIKKILSELRESVNNLEQVLKNRVDIQTLAVTDGLKYRRTLERYNNLV